MKPYVAVLISLVASTAFAQEPAFTHGPIGFQPKGWDSAQLTETQKKDLDACLSDAAKNSEASKKDRAALDSLYGFKPGQMDYYGAALSGCLTDEKHGKGWIAVQRSGQLWEPVSSRYALRTFMGMDPSK